MSFFEQFAKEAADAARAVSKDLSGFPQRAKDDIILAAFAVDDIDKKAGTVKFDAIPEAIRPGQGAVFLKNVEEKDDDGSFTAERVKDDAELVKLLTTIATINEDEEDEVILKEGLKPLFCIHGFLGAPWTWINPIASAQQEYANDKNIKLIPVLWPAGGIINPNVIENIVPLSYRYYTRRSAAEASSRPMANAFQKAFTKLDKEGVKMDVVGTSMGNWVLKELANKRINEKDNEGQTFTFLFENIFMNASDVRSDIFTSNEGQNIIDMANNDGLVIVHYNQSDGILELATNSFLVSDIKRWVRRFLIWVPEFIPRLGWKGIIGQPEPGDKRKKLVQYDCTSEVEAEGNPLFVGHGYIFDKFLFDKFYGKKSVEIKDVEGVEKF